MTDDEHHDLITMTAEIVSAFAANEHARIAPDDLATLIRTVRATLSEVEVPVDAAVEANQPKPSKAEIRKSITPDALISFVDGRPFKSLKRHLSTLGMTPADYRSRYGLPTDYPMVAASYSAARSQMARDLGLGARGRGGGMAPPTARAKRMSKAAT